MKGLGVWFLPHERTIPNASRSIRSKGKSSLLQGSPTSSKGESVADCHDQTSFVEFASSKDPAMVNAVETPSVITKTGTCDIEMQRNEARSHRRNDVPVKRGKAHDTLEESTLSKVGNNSREKGGTQELLTVHPQL